MAAVPIISAAAAVVGTGFSIYNGITSANNQKAAQAQVTAAQERQQKQADARAPNIAAIMGSAQAKAGTTSGTNITGPAGLTNSPLGGGDTLLGGS